jgi:hypothetical protein
MNKGKFFIKKISQQLTDKLNELGYEDCWSGYIHTQEVETMIFVFDGKWSLSGFPPRSQDGFIDCGTNEELFLALAEYDKKLVRNQWFICQEEYLGNNLRVVPVGEWQKNTSRDKLTYSLKRLWRKATIEEIIEHFK